MNRRGDSNIDDYKIYEKGSKAKPVDEKCLKIIVGYCSHFGCGKKLSLVEKLCGDKCIEHSVKTRKVF